MMFYQLMVSLLNLPELFLKLYNNVNKYASFRVYSSKRCVWLNWEAAVVQFSKLTNGAEDLYGSMF